MGASMRRDEPETTGAHSSGRGGAAEVFAVFLRLGLTSFGGPIAHLGYFREQLVARRGWLTEQRYAELVALCQFLPGPSSSQLGFAVGLDRAGGRGGLAAWIGFTLPSAALMFAVAMGAALSGGPIGSGAVAGLGCVAVAVVAHAVWSMARTLTPDLRRIAIALASAALALLAAGALGQLAAVLLGVVAGMLLCRSDAGSTQGDAARDDAADDISGEDRTRRTGVSKRAAAVCLVLLVVGLAALPILAATLQTPLLRLADAFFRTGALVFGGGHVVLPLLQAEPAVAAAVTPGQFLTGYSAAQAMPGPLFSFAAYLGAVSQPGGALAALLPAAVALVAVFLPGMLLLVGVLPFWGELRSRPFARAAVRGANAAVVGLLAAALCTPVIATGITGPGTLAIALGCLGLLALRAPVWAAVLGGAAAGALARLLGWA